MAVLSLAWVLRQPGVSCAIVGCRNTLQLQKNIEALRYDLSDGVARELDVMTEALWRLLGDNPDYYESEVNSRIR